MELYFNASQIATGAVLTGINAAIAFAVNYNLKKVLSKLDERKKAAVKGKKQA